MGISDSEAEVRKASSLGCFATLAWMVACALGTPALAAWLSEWSVAAHELARIGFPAGIAAAMGLGLPAFIAWIAVMNRDLERFLRRSFSAIGMRGYFSGNQGAFRGMLGHRDSDALVHGATRYRRSSLTLRVATTLQTRLAVAMADEQGAAVDEAGGLAPLLDPPGWAEGHRVHAADARWGREVLADDAVAEPLRALLEDARGSELSLVVLRPGVVILRLVDLDLNRITPTAVRAWTDTLAAAAEALEARPAPAEVLERDGAEQVADANMQRMTARRSGPMRPVLVGTAVVLPVVTIAMVVGILAGRATPPPEDRLHAIAPAGDGFVVVGARQSGAWGERDAWVLGLDASGEKRWEHTPGSAGDDWGHDVVALNGEEVLVGGSWNTHIPSRARAWVARLDADGKERWLRAHDQGKWSSGFALQRTGAGETLLAGSSGDPNPWVLTLDDDGGAPRTAPLTRAAVGVLRDVRAADGAFVAAGWTGYGEGAWEHRPRVLRAAPSGTRSWDVDLPSGGEARAVWPQGGGAVAAGWCDPGPAGEIDGRLTALGPEGEIRWDLCYGETGDDRLYALQPFGDGWLAVGTQVDADGSPQGWIFQVDADGNGQRQRLLGEPGPGDEELLDVVVLDDGRIAAAGMRQVPGEGARGWVVLLDAELEPIWERTY